MALLTWYDKADIHREVCATILDAFVPHGQRGKFIESVGYSKQWYVYIRQANSVRMPSLKAARKMAENLPAPKEYQQAFLHHLTEARKAYEAAYQEVFEHTTLRRPIDDYLEELRSSFQVASFSQEIHKARTHYQRVLHISKVLVGTLHPEIYLLEYLEACSLLAHVSYIFDQAANGLYWAKLGQLIADVYDIENLKNYSERELLDIRRFLLTRDEGLAYYNLNQPKFALQCYDRAEILLPKHHILSPEIYRNKLLSLSTLPRFVIGNARDLARQAEKAFDKTGDQFRMLMNNEALARTYIAYGNWLNLRRAKKLLHSTLEQLDSSSNAGPLLRTVVLVTTARLYWCENDRSSWEYMIKQALKIINDAGLFHQYRKILKEYGNAIAPFINCG